MYSASAKAANPILTYKDEAIYRVGDSLRDKQNNYLLKKGQSAVFTATQSHYNNLLSIRCNLVKGQKDKVAVSTMIPDSLYSLVFSTPFTYSSSNLSVVTVDSSGYIQGQADGTALVTVSTVDGVTAVCSVKVSSGQASKPSDTSKPTKPDGKPSNERITVKATKIRSITNLKGKKNRVYYVRARAYKFNASGKKVYGSWSAKKRIRIRK